VSDEQERRRRWRLVLGEQDGGLPGLQGGDLARDRVLTQVYEAERGGDLSRSAPAVARWLGDIRTYFPSSIVRVMQQDAFERLHLKQMLLQPEMLEAVTPDVHLVATLLSLNSVIPPETRETARQVVRKVTDELQQRLAARTRQAIMGSINRTVRSRRPHLKEIDWDRTIRANLRHYQPEERTIIPERLVGVGRGTRSLQDIVLCVDQSGSMAPSVVYASIFGAVLASLRAVTTRMIVFDTAVADLTESLSDPVDLLFGTQLGGGTDINRALTYCESVITRPTQSVLVLISDLFEGGNATGMLERAALLIAAGVQMIVLLALSDSGAPAYNHNHARALAGLGIPTFACTPDLFPDMMAAALARRDVALWASQHGIITTRAWE
jgi:Mg-chelatase subunit ChlD